MSSKSIRHSVDNLKETALDAYHDLRDATHDHLVEPLADAGHRVAKATRHGMENVADYSRRGAHRTESWISSNPLPATGIAFGAGLLAGMYLLGKYRQ